jgi:hypothetical protein
MRQRRLAVLALGGGVLILITALGIWIQRLEQRVATLEQRAETRVAVASAVPVALAQRSPDWTTSDHILSDNGVTLHYESPPGATPQPYSGRLPNGSPLPEGTTSHEINGLTYYVMPLSHEAKVPRPE